MAKRAVEVCECDRCGKEPANTWIITGPDGGPREIELCDQHAAPIANAYALGRPVTKKPARSARGRATRSAAPRTPAGQPAQEPAARRARAQAAEPAPQQPAPQPTQQPAPQQAPQQTQQPASASLAQPSAQQTKRQLPPVPPAFPNLESEAEPIWR